MAARKEVYEAAEKSHARREKKERASHLRSFRRGSERMLTLRPASSPDGSVAAKGSTTKKEQFASIDSTSSAGGETGGTIGIGEGSAGGMSGAKSPRYGCSNRLD